MHGARHQARDEERNGRIDEGDDAKHRAEACGALGVIERVAQDEVADHQQHEDEIRGEARLPDPPDTPLETRPHVARDHRGDDEHERDLHCRARGTVVRTVLRSKEAGGEKGCNHHRRERRHGHRDVQIKDFLAEQQLGGDHLTGDNRGL